LARTRRSTRAAEPTPSHTAEPGSAPPGTQPTDQGAADSDAAAREAEPKPAPRRRAAKKADAPDVAAPSAAAPTVPESGPEPERPPAAAAAARRRIVVTGGAGFVGSHVVDQLTARGDDVVALVRDPARAGRIAESGAQLVADDLSSVPRLAGLLEGADAVIHVAGSYRVGISRAERGVMWDANVGTTTRILDAAEVARTPRVVYVSTVNAFGNTRGRVVDEAYRRDLRDGFLTWYDETKYGAHEVAEQRQAADAPVIIVLPSQVYGPGDPSGFGEQLRLASQGRLRYRALDEVSVGLVHVEDLAAGIVAALDRGETGQAYVLSGPRASLREAMTIATRAAGRRPPRLRIPTRMLRLMAPLGRFIGQPNLREVISASAGVTYWASAEKAERELGFRPRDLETGLANTFGRG
jgi:nucleoside-diphosphate-sugar epimerase